MGNCEKCLLPGIMRRMQGWSDVYRNARANATLAESSTERERYEAQIMAAADELRAVQEQFNEFMVLWGGVCDGCRQI